jgi:hypothetical protein
MFRLGALPPRGAPPRDILGQKNLAVLFVSGQ